MVSGAPAAEIRVRVFALVLFAALFGARAEAESRPEGPRDGELEAGAEDRIDRRIDQVAAELAARRGLGSSAPIDRRVVSERELKARLAELEARQGGERGRAGRFRAMARLGLPDPGGAPREALRGARVFYDPSERRLYVASGGGLDDGALALEVARALRDRHIAGRSFFAATSSADETAARLALAEGDAAALVLERAMVSAGYGVAWGDASVARSVQRFGLEVSRAPEVYADLPPAVRDRLLFPYREGLAFVARIRRHHPWSRIDAMYERPPLSTSHILDPARYARYDRPYRIEAGGIALDRLYRPIYDDVSGELGLRIWLRHHGVGGARARRAAAGWGGDRLVVYAPPSRLGGAWPDLAVSYSAWTTEADAVEFFEAAARALPSALGGEIAHVAADRVVCRTPGGELAWVERRGRDVALVIGALHSKAETVRKAVWESWIVDRG